MRRWNGRITVWLVAGVAVLLPLLAGLQYHWLGELSEQERQRMEGNLQVATRRFTQDFDRQIGWLSRTFAIRHVHRDESPLTPERAAQEIASAYQDWRTSFAFPELIKTVYVLSIDPSGAFQVRRVRLEDGKLESVERPSWLASLPPELARAHTGEAPIDTFLDEIPALVLQNTIDPPSWTMVELNRHVLVEELLPAQVEEYLSGPEDLDYDIWIVDAADPGKLVYASNPDAKLVERGQTDIEAPLFRVRFPSAIRRGGPSAEPRWQLLLRHRSGSLENAVAIHRGRNLALSFGVLLLLAATIVLLLISTRRAQALAQQQMEFVAGVSHELRTPLAGISSLSQNLGVGLVQGEEPVRKYGNAIYEQSRKLADMIERLLQFSSIQSGNQKYHFEAADLNGVVLEAISTFQPELDRRFELNLQMPHDGVPVRADSRALRSALENLVSNAMKFSKDGAPIDVSVDRLPEDVRITVEDRGRGIESSEISQIFIPFYRGKESRENQTEGSGLGLSLVKKIVEAHGGRVSVESTPGHGSKFTVHLPLLAKAEEAR